MIRKLLALFLVATLSLSLAACGNKGKLKSPTQMRNEEAKKAKKEAQKKEDEADPVGDQQDDSVPATPAPTTTPSAPETK